MARNPGSRCLPSRPSSSRDGLAAAPCTTGKPFPAWPRRPRERSWVRPCVPIGPSWCDLANASHGGFEYIPEGWEDRLFDSFLLQLNDPSQESFLDCVESICYELLRRGSEVGAAQDVLVAFRRHIMACANDTEVRARIEDLLQEALLSASDLAAIAQSRRRSALMDRMTML